MIRSARRQAERVARGLTRRGREGAARAARTAEIARAVASSAEPSQVLRIAGRATHLVGRRRFTLDEAFTLGLLDPDAPASLVADTISKEEMIRLQARLNPDEFWYLTEDKAIFYRFAELQGIPVPKLYAILCESGPGWSHTGTIVAGVDDWERVLLEETPDQFVVKPARGFYGFDVRVIERRDGLLHQVGGAPISATELARELIRNRQFHVYIVQERLHNHPDVPGGRTALQTSRIMTLVERDGGVSVVGACHKTSFDGATDNFRLGRTGNLTSLVDSRTGRIEGVQRAGEHGVLEGIAMPPDMSMPVPGAFLPQWEACLEVVSAAAKLFLPMRTIGWDVAVTPTGPVIVEANMWWDPIGEMPAAHRGLEAPSA